jgi:tetratricopeptide (TPR) repeat protein
VKALAARLRRYVRQLELAPAGRQLADRIVAHPSTEWPSRFARTRLTAHVHALTAFLDHAHARLDDNPREALVLSDLVLGKIIPGPGAAIANLYGRAWREQGYAWHTIGDLPQALRAFEGAISAFSADRAAEVKVAVVRSEVALVHHQLGDSKEALTILRSAAEVLEAHDESEGIARCHLYEGVIHLENNRYERAVASFETALGLVRALGDGRTAARLYLNLGKCAQARGSRGIATDYFLRAIGDFERQDMVLDRQRVVRAMALTMAAEGFVDRAVDALEGIAKELRAAGVLREAALIRVDVVEILATAGLHERAAATAPAVIRALTAQKMFDVAKRLECLISYLGGDESKQVGNA